MPYETPISRHFARLGARFRVRHNPGARRWSLDVVRDNHGTTYELRGDRAALSELDLIVSNVDRASRHLLLLVREGTDTPLHRFLCGHDERDWFMATVPEPVTTVARAMEALKPGAVRAAQQSAGLKRKEQNRRHNRAYLRQGEWFFIPAPTLRADGLSTLGWEPIRRGNGSPHMVQEVLRTGGEVVHFFRESILTADEFALHRTRISQKEASMWRSGIRNARVFGRGLVRHRDHATLLLKGWHEILPNTEAQASIETQQRMAFID